MKRRKSNPVEQQKNMLKTAEEAIIQETISSYRSYYNPSLTRLLKLSGFDTVEWEGDGVVMKDVRGKEYLDFLGGYGVFVAGHRHPRIVQAVREQLDRLPLSCKVFFSEPLGKLVKKLAEVTPGALQYSFICNSGTEAVEGALKLARFSTGRPQIISAINAFHGKTLGSLSVSGREVYKTPFEPLLPEMAHVPFGDLEALGQAVSDRTAAVILEPIQGEGGVIIPPSGYLRGVRDLCTKSCALFIADEVQTGLGRTGEMFAVNHEQVTPDILLLAKGLGGGVMPIGAFVGTPAVWEAFAPNPLIHTSTFGGNPLACAAALATLQVIEEERLVERAKARGAFLFNQLQRVREAFPSLVREVRGKGLMVGVEMKEEKFGGAIFPEMIRRGVIVAYTLNQPKVIRFEPPLIISEEQILRGVDAFKGALEKAGKMFHAL